MTEGLILNTYGLDQYVLEILKRSPDTWNTAKALAPDVLDTLIEHTETAVQKALDRLESKKLVRRAFNNVGDKSYIVYRVPDKE